MNKIYLIGFMGAGKTTIGQKLSEILKLSFIDVDQYIEKKYETDIPTIFKTYGEEKFREYEMISLKELTKYAIVATGGGIVEKKENIRSEEHTSELQSRG